jgi:long-chain acyl-CoA synthetase
MNQGTLTKLFFDAVERHAGRPAAYRAKIGGEWKPLTHREVEARVRNASLGLRELGVVPGDRVSLISENRPEWAIADYACLCARAADVPIYPTLPTRQAEYILRDSGAVAVFCSTAAQLAKVLEVRSALPALRHVIAFDEDAKREGVLTFAELEEKGRAAAGKYPRFKEEALAVGPNDLATLIYTSGTTGDPKGVMLTHDNIYSNVKAGLEVMPVGPGYEALSMLPLSHIFERMVAYTLFHAGVVINYAESFEAVAANLQEVKPTVVLSVPRLYEKVYARVLENALAGGAAKRKIFLWAKAVGEQWADHTLAGLPVPGGLAFQKRIADKLVFSKLKQRTGGRIKFFISGGAPLSAEIAKFFIGAGLPIAEGYGLTETSPVLTLNPLHKIKIGTVGRPVPGIQIKIAADGEILAKGPNIMRGYRNKPDATREAIDDGGGSTPATSAARRRRLSQDHRPQEGPDRHGGRQEHRAPAIENLVKTSQVRPQRRDARDKRKYPIMLVVPNLESVEVWAKERNLAYKSRSELITLPDVRAKIEREVMDNLRDLAKFEMPKKIVLVEEDFTVDNGMLTPTLKVKRRVVEQRHAGRIEQAYAEGDVERISTTVEL